MTEYPFEFNESHAEYRDGGRWTERHLQCVWYNEALRPARLVTDDGDEVQVESCGRWNLEAGPDFLGAVLIVGPERRRLCGDIELHIRPANWTQHRHSSDPRYANVIAHVTYFPGPRAEDMPDTVIAVSLRDALRETPGFSFDDIDISAYPHAVLPTTPRPCQTSCGENPDHAIAILEAAGRFRLEIKRRRMADAIEACGDPMQAFYENVMAALGYKQNAQIFRDLARAYPLSVWEADVETNYARLLGIGGLLPDNPSADADIAKFARRLWDIWWHNPVNKIELSGAWRMNSVRPLNHPVRRLAVAAALFTDRTRIEKFIAGLDPSREKFVKTACAALADMARFEAAERVCSLTGKALEKPAALLGASRATAIAVNALIPFIAATRPDAVPGIYSGIPSETVSAPMRTMANRLFGRDHNPSVIYAADGLRQQGLLQIFSDYCLSARGGCAECLFGKMNK